MPEVSGHIHDNNRNIASITHVGNMRPEKQRPPKQTVQAPPAHADQALQTTKHQSQTNAHPTHRVLIAAPHQVLTPPTHQPQTPPNPPARSLVSALCSIPKAPPRKRTRKCESATVITSSPYKKVLEEKQKDKKSKTKATVTLRRGLTRCPRFEQNSRNRQSASDRLQPRVLIRAVGLHTQTDEKWRTHTVEIVCERLNRV